MSRLEESLTKRLKERELAGNIRSLNTLHGGIDFCSNDYLGLSATGLLSSLVQEAYTTTGSSGSTGSRLLSGNNELFEQLEAKIAAFHGGEAALIFNSGYEANIGLIAAIAGRHTIILYDELCHASIIDGIRLGICPGKYKFNHNNLSDLKEKLAQYGQAYSLIVIAESVYSMDGDFAPLAEMAELCQQYDARLIIDEAHATGIYGKNGAGMVCALGLGGKVFARVHTFGKALGCHGAVVVGSALLKEYLVNFARTFIYTTALPPHSVWAISCAYDYISSPAFSSQPLHSLIAYFRERVKENNIAGWIDSHSPIQAFVTGGNEQCKSLALRLQQAGLQVKPILSPTVARGMERLRVCLHSFNTRDEVDLLAGMVREQEKYS